MLRAIRRVDGDPDVRVTGASSLYDTSPVGVTSPRSFVNAVARVETLLFPTDLLKRLQGIERDLGRFGGHNAPREIDIDIIVYGDTVMETPDLVVPHPRYADRAFVLVPLAEIEPGFSCPMTGHSVDRMMQQLANAPRAQRVTRISGRMVTTL